MDGKRLEDIKKLLSYIETPEVTSKNIESPRAYYIPEQSQSLNGVWSFAMHDSVAGALESVYEGKNDNWTDMKVPGHWQLQGFGNPQYVNVQYPFPVNPPYIPTENPTGVYNRSFWVDQDTSNYHNLLRFDGVDSAFYVFLNNQFIGFSKGSRNPTEFDINSHLEPNKFNSLTVIVTKWCDASYIEDQDQWRLSGKFSNIPSSIWLAMLFSALGKD